MSIHIPTVIDGMDKAAAQAELEISGGAWTDPSTDHTASGTTQSVTVGEDVAFGDLLYIKSDGKWWKSDADAVATMPGLRMALEARGILPATETVFESGHTNYTSVAMLSTTKAIVCYQDEGDAYKGKACILTISDTTITAGDVVEFEAGNTNYISVAALSADKAIVCYMDNGNSDKGTARILSISGTTITTPEDAIVFEDGMIMFTSVAMLTDSKAIVCYRDVGNSNYGTACILSVSGAVITAGTPDVFEAATTNFPSVAMLTDSKAIVCYVDAGNSNYGTSCILSISETTITAETPVVFEAANSYSTYVAALSATKAIVCYQDTGNSSYGTACVLSVSGTTITAGTPAVFENASAEYISVAALAADRAIVCYQDTGNSSYGTACVLSVSGTTITAETPVVFEAAAAVYISVAMITGGKPVVCYRDGGNSNYGTARVLSAASLSDPCPALIIGLVRDDTWTWTVGGIIYASTTAGEITQTAPSGSADIVQVVGVAYHADKMIFQPSLVMVEIA